MAGYNPNEGPKLNPVWQRENVPGKTFRADVQDIKNRAWKSDWSEIADHFKKKAVILKTAIGNPDCDNVAYIKSFIKHGIATVRKGCALDTCDKKDRYQQVATDIYAIFKECFEKIVPQLSSEDWQGIVKIVGNNTAGRALWNTGKACSKTKDFSELAETFSKIAKRAFEHPAANAWKANKPNEGAIPTNKA